MTLPERAEVVIVGGGVMGTSIAFHLAEAGVTDILLLERNELGSGSTSKAAGGVRANFSDELNIALGARSLEAFALVPERDPSTSSPSDSVAQLHPAARYQAANTKGDDGEPDERRRRLPADG